MPEHGDDLDAYVKHLIVPGTWAIPHKPGTDECHYLAEGRCSIHATRPAICRAFSCVQYFLNTPRAERRRRERTISGSREIFARGRELSLQQQQENEP